MSNGMKKTLQYVFGFVALIVVTLVVAPFFINVNDYKDEISQKMEDATGRAMTIGDIQISLFPWVGVELEDVHLANPAGFADRDFVAVKHLDVKVAVLPLLDGRYEIKEFILNTPDIYLERHANGQTNWDDLTGSEKTPAVAAKPAAPGKKKDGGKAASEAGDKAQGNMVLAGLKADHITIQHGRVTWVDAQKDARYELAELDVSLEDVQLDRPIRLDLSGTLQGDAFSVKGQLGPLGDPAKLEIERLPLQADISVDSLHLGSFKKDITGWPEILGPIDDAVLAFAASVEQRPDGMRMLKGRLGLNATHVFSVQWNMDSSGSDMLDIREATMVVDQKPVLKLTGTVKHLGGEPAYELKVSSDKIERTWLTTFIPELEAMYAGHPSPWKHVRMTSLLAGSATAVDIRDVQLFLDDELLHGSGHFIMGNTPDIRLQLAGKELHLGPWLPQGKADDELDVKTETSTAQQAAPAGQDVGGGDQPAETEPDLRFLKNWLISARMEIGILHMRGLQMRQFRMNIQGAKGKIRLSPLRFGLAGGKVEEQAVLMVAQYPARWTESVHVMGVHVGPVLQAIADTDQLEGTLTMETNLKATGLTQKAIRRLNGKGNIMLRDGKIKGFDIAGAIRKFTNPVAAQSGPQETDFAQLSGSFTIHNGVLSNKDLFMASPLLRVTGAGTVNLVQKMLDYHVKPTVVGTLKGQGDTVTIRKGFSIPLHLSGSFDDVKVRPEVDAKSLIQSVGNVGAGGSLGGIAGKLLGGGNNKQTTQQKGKKRKKAGNKNQAPAGSNPLGNIPLPF